LEENILSVKRKLLAILVLMALALLVPTLALADTITAPSITTGTATSILRTTATLSASITSTGGATVTTRGVQYGLTQTGTWDSHETGAFSAGGYSRPITGLTPQTTYWFRGYASNSKGTTYGSWVSFATKEYPSILTIAASSVAGTSARLNSGLASDGNDYCIITFGWGLSSASSVGAYDSYQVVSGTYSSGDYPYLDISGLLPGHAYYFRVMATNDIGTNMGLELTFETPMTLSAPTNFLGNPKATSITLVWSKGAGSTNTLVRYSQTDYPETITDGIEAYFGAGNTYILEGLSSGKNYYFTAWGEDGGNYSSDFATFIMTTSARSATDIPDIDVPSQPSRWFTTDYTAMSRLGILYDSINAVVDTGRIPRATAWFWLALGLAFLAGLLGYLMLGHKLLIAMICMTVVMALEYFAQQVPFWMPLMTLVLVIAFSTTHKEVSQP
jgi:hypothetical protein